MILIGFVILSNFYFALAESEKNNEVCFEELTKLEPSFSLITRSNTPVINKGDPLEFEIYITGYGSIPNNSKIYVSIPIDLVDSNITYGFVNHFFILKNTEYERFSTLDNMQIKRADLAVENGFSIDLPSFLYSQLQYSETVDGCYYNTILAENKVNISNEHIPPMLIRINTSENAPEGDNKMDLILTYSDDKKVYQDKNEIKFHINSWNEEHEVQFSIIIFFIGALVVASTSFIWNYIYIKVKSHFKTNESIKTEKSNNQ